MPCLGTTGVRPASRARRLAAGLGQCSPDRAACSNRSGPKRAVASAGGDADGARPAGTAAGDTRRRQPAGASKSTHAVGVGPAEASDGQGAHPSARAPPGRPRCERPTPAPDRRPGPECPPKAGPSCGPRHQARPRRANGRRPTAGPAAPPRPAALLSAPASWAAIAAAAVPPARVPLGSRRRWARLAEPEKRGMLGEAAGFRGRATTGHPRGEANARCMKQKPAPNTKGHAMRCLFVLTTHRPKDPQALLEWPRPRRGGRPPVPQYVLSRGTCGWPAAAAAATRPPQPAQASLPMPSAPLARPPARSRAFHRSNSAGRRPSLAERRPQAAPNPTGRGAAHSAQRRAARAPRVRAPGPRPGSPRRCDAPRAGTAAGRRRPPTPRVHWGPQRQPRAPRAEPWAKTGSDCGPRFGPTFRSRNRRTKQ